VWVDEALRLVVNLRASMHKFSTCMKEEPIGVSQGDPSRMSIPGGKKEIDGQGECALRPPV